MGTRADEDPLPTAVLGIGMLGHGFMGKAHVHALRSFSYLAPSQSNAPEPRLVALGGHDPERTAAAARRYGFECSTTDWRKLVTDPEIALFDNAGPNDLHAEPTMAALRAGKHVLCEKPLGRTAAESHAIWSAAEAAGVVHMCGFNYRFVPAIRLARELIEAGELGEVHRFRAAYLQDWLADPEAPHGWRLDRDRAGSGALGDIGAHAIDLARFLVGEIAAVDGRVGAIRTVEVDDSVEATIEFADGPTGSISASRLCHGRRNSLTLEVNGTKGSLAFDLERLNELQLYVAGSGPTERAQGFRRVLVTDRDHPYLDHWWPPGHTLGWADTFVHELHHLLGALAGDHEVAPYGATFEDGYRAAEICDAVLRSSASGAREPVAYRPA
ncbi:MAG TPA: Gfo/Idh/MocA family oxidoreductase [Thermoleophilaceae bacterium]|nr:Gfo/Idh/MocA family oxidoreductase [Thermoleophilaceae bacterium]